jgi:hypothetical protein
MYLIDDPERFICDIQGMRQRAQMDAEPGRVVTGQQVQGAAGALPVTAELRYVSSWTQIPSLA